MMLLGDMYENLAGQLAAGGQLDEEDLEELLGVGPLGGYGPDSDDDDDDGSLDLDEGYSD